MNPTSRHQQGSFLLEALIAIMIIALGVLGSVGMLARSVQDMDDAKNRGEAAYLANMLIGQMWLSDRVTANLDTNYSSALGTGAGYLDFKTMVEQRLPNADKYVQEVVINPGPIPANLASSVVTISIYWCPPGEWITAASACRGAAGKTARHQFNISASIGAN
jgi:type IV pilus assembly protein PilV